MVFRRASIRDVIIIEPRVWEDERGFFLESFRRDTFKAHGISAEFVQDNFSRSRRGVLRGLHYQIKRPQGKLIRITAGKIFDVAVDLRHESPTFGRWVGLEVSADNKFMVWVPPGFAHGFYVVSDYADIIYKATDYHAPEWERTLIWNDKELGIGWPIATGRAPILSEKDAAGKPLRETEVYK
jgi:dTDP-4-dehydrorhamnose 3,5-epimerase